MYCNRCEISCDEGSNYCPKCGKPLPAPLVVPRQGVVPRKGADVPCAQCGAKSLRTSRYCWSCGYPLATGAAEAAVPTWDSADVMEMLRGAREHQKRGEFEAAIALASEAAKAAPKYVAARELLGDLYAAAGNNAEAAKEYAAALKLLPGSATLRQKFARASGKPLRDARPATPVVTPGSPDEMMKLLSGIGERPWYRAPWTIAAFVAALLLAIGIAAAAFRAGRGVSVVTALIVFITCALIFLVHRHQSSDASRL